MNIKFLKLKAIWNILRSKPVIANCKFIGGINIKSTDALIINNTMLEF